MLKNFKRILLAVMLLALTCPGWAVPAVAAGEGGLQYGEKKELAPGVTYYSFDYKDWSGQGVKGYITEITPGAELLEIRPALGNEVLGGRETVSGLAARHGAVAAVNGGFFDGGSGNPIGGLVMDGAAHYQMDVLRTSLGWTGKGEFKFSYFDPDTVVSAGSISFNADVFNRMPQSDQIALYTPLRQGGIPAAGLVYAALQKEEGNTYTVVEGAPGPRQYALVFGAGREPLAASLSAGDKLQITFGYGSGLEGIEHLVTGGPLLVEDGIPVFQAVNEGYRGSVLSPNARTAVGIKGNKNILLVVVEKSKPAAGSGNGGDENKGSAGLTLDELAWVMAKLGVVKAAALDGGGSSVMWAGGKTVSVPSDSSERKVANALLVLYQIPSYLDGHRVYFDVPPMVDGGRAYVPLRGIFELLGAEVTWQPETNSVLAVRGERSIKLTIGQNQALVGDSQVTLDAPPKMVNNRTMVPVRFVSESLGARVDWSNSPKALYLYSPSGEVL